MDLKNIYEIETLTNTMKELILCFVFQDLNEIPWTIKVQEFLMLIEIKDRINAKGVKK